MSQNNSNSNASNGNGHVKRAYSDKQIAEALTILKGCNGNLLQASKEAGVPRKTLERWSKGTARRVEASGEDLATLRHIAGKSIADRLETLIFSILDVAPSKLKDAHFGQAMTGLAIATDKMRLLREQPTQIQGTGDDEFGQMVKEYAKRFHLPLSVARENIKRNLTNPTAIAALDAIELASEEKQ